MRSTLLMCVLALSQADCASRAALARPSHIVLPKLAAETIRPFALEQQLHGKYGEQEVNAHVVLQFETGVLRLVGLSPMGSRAFVVEQRGTEVHVENTMGRELPFDAKHVLVDVHRVLFRSAGPALAEGVQQRVDQGELVRDVYREGRLVERRFVAANQPNGRAVVITFSSKASPVTAPKVRINNQELGYTLEIETLSQQWL